jgi:hypothetical protein
VSLGKNKSRSGPTKATNNRATEIYNTARRAGNAPIPTSVTGGLDYYGQATGAGRQGLDALTGNAEAQQQFMNPYQQQVIDRLNEQFGVQNQMTMQGVNDAATQAGAFGGSRHGIATGTALAQNAQNQGLQVAGLLNQGFEGAQNRAAQVAGLGFDAAGAGATLGMQAGNKDLWKLGVLQRGFNPMQTGASSGWNLGLPWGGGGR